MKKAYKIGTCINPDSNSRFQSKVAINDVHIFAVSVFIRKELRSVQTSLWFSNCTLEVGTTKVITAALTQ